MLETSKFSAFVEFTRPYNSAVVLLNFAIGHFLLSRSINVSFWLAVLVLVLLHSAATIRNDLEDRRIDAINSPQKPLVAGRVSETEARTLELILVAVALVAGIWDLRIFLISLVVLGLSYLYNSPPFFLSRKPISSILVLGLLYSLLPLMLGMTLSDNLTQLGVHHLVIVLSFFVIRLSTSLLKDYNDVKGDRKQGKDTFLLTYGGGITGGGSLLLGLAGYLGLAWGTYFLRGWQARDIVVLVLILILSLLRLRITSVGSFSEAHKLFLQIFSLENTLGFVYFLFLIL